MTSVENNNSRPQPMQKALSPKLLILLSSVLFVSGCSNWSIPTIPGVYKIDIQQGNVIEQDMIDTLRPGMTKRQVRFVMGTPLLVDPFQPDRWEYVYSFQPGGGQRTQEQVALFFEDDKLTHFTGHFRPTANQPAKDAKTEGEREVAPEELLEEGAEEEEEDGSFLFLKF